METEIDGETYRLERRGAKTPSYTLQIDFDHEDNTDYGTRYSKDLTASRRSDITNEFLEDALKDALQSIKEKHSGVEVFRIEVIEKETTVNGKPLEDWVTLKCSECGETRKEYYDTLAGYEHHNSKDRCSGEWEVMED